MVNTLELVLALLAGAVLVVGIFRSLNLPPVLGYLMVGAAVGPHAMNLMPDSDSARYLAEFGVVFLMFTIGLEFSLARLYSMKRIVFGLGAMQVLASIVLVMIVGRLAGLGWGAGFALGGTLAMSSTAILSKLLSDRLELDSKHGREAIGVLLFQDIAVVPLLILIPTLSGSADALFGTLALATVKAVVLLGLVLFFGQGLMRRWFFLVARQKSAELFMLNVLFITLGLAWMTETAGLSLALGAFLAGMLISETEYRYHVEEDIKPFRDVLLGLFFVTVGMFLDVGQIILALPAVLALLAALLVGKFLIAGAASLALGSPQGTAARTGLWLCAGGEFGFVLLSQIEEAQLMPASLSQVVVAALVLSMLLAPLIVQASERIVLRLVPSEWMSRSLQLTSIATQSMFVDKHAILCGFGRNGQYLGRLLEQEGITYIALDLDPERVRDAAAAGETVVFGDAAKRETLMAAGISRASVVVITYADTDAALRAMSMVRACRPDVPVVVRTADEVDLERLRQAGAAEVVPESVESSLMLASHALALAGIPLPRIVKRIREIRAERYHLLRGIYRGGEHLHEEALEERQQVRLHSVTLNAGAYAIGKSLADLRLRELGAEITAVRRQRVRLIDLAPDMLLGLDDVLVLLGTPSQLAGAETRLLKGL
ncbi:MAG TPA: cation:proton antiporter [Zoogloea sp.]|jgi:CPA2 family monovalent cation:H+ antiporter-2|uniref:cation:proton antiporter domain-containing protein n=1 Tax=Zoogloea sp. TaxID=49181 RepID=UPI002BBA8B09|nr:cation:proton antiporter [Zoogloea sp.]HOB45659.1 cation:proton antiporter [Zoogloea sp.]HQA09632.1 cation:proton antiporter [Zoogloea sp.]HQE38287.1 cation:proton antiporter [Zoogloea sp.]